MNIGRLQFFDKDGYNLNFDWNSRHRCWEGNIYLPKVSVGLYANTTIYVLEETPNGNTDDEFTNDYCFPSGEGTISFSWDRNNTFVDEFFMFSFDETYTLKETSSLVYTPNDGPDCIPLVINRFDTYDIPLDGTRSPKALPVHVAFRANESHDATTYTRTLMMTYNGSVIARIRFYAETVEEDERLKIWNSNLGYDIKPEDTIIFYKSDIKEYMPDYILLNEKRKELMLEGSSIYPYIGSYLAIINAIKFFGYDNLNIVEYWRNINRDDENFGKIYHTSRYSLTKKETLSIGARRIVLPNKDYRKVNALALVYDINKITGEIDEWELPKVKEQFAYTIEEAIVKLFALRKKLNREFMPGSSRIIDIIGEGNYFGIQSISKIGDTSYIDKSGSDLRIDFEAYPKKYVHITDNEYFNRYIILRQNTDTAEIPLKERMISDMLDYGLDEYDGSEDIYMHNPEDTMGTLSNSELCGYYLDYFRETNEDHTLFKNIDDNDVYPFDSEEYGYYMPPEKRFSAKVVLRLRDFDPITFDSCDLRFDCRTYGYTVDDGGGGTSGQPHSIDFTNPMENTPDGQVPYGQGESHYTFGNIDDVMGIKSITWSVRMSEPENQYDDDLRNAGIVHQYESREIDIPSWTDDDNTGEYFLELPYIGYYDVTVEVNGQRRTKKKCIKVEPYQIEMMGFYYDVRSIPSGVSYDLDEDSEMYRFIQDSIDRMYGWAASERSDMKRSTDMSVPLYDASGNMKNNGPYYNENMNNEWYLADNISYEMTTLKPMVKYTRYIRNGVDVKPYTWFLLGYEYSRIAGKVSPKWKITNINTGASKEFEGRYLTLLLKKEGNYRVDLTLDDMLGNRYSVSRNIIVVSKSANYKLYQTFKKEYDYLTEQNLLKELNDVYYTGRDTYDENA